MSLYFIEGPAGTGKTTRLFQELERVLEERPLADHQQVLAMTKMHGSRRRMDGRLRRIPDLRRRYRCCTADSFAWSVVRRWRTLARTTLESQLAEEDYEQVCSLAGDLLSDTAVSRWVSRAYPIVVVDEFQDSKRGQLAMISSLCTSATCIAAADDYQDLESTEENPAVAWARSNCDSREPDRHSPDLCIRSPESESSPSSRTRCSSQSGWLHRAWRTEPQRRG